MCTSTCMSRSLFTAAQLPHSVPTKIPDIALLQTESVADKARRHANDAVGAASDAVNPSGWNWFGLKVS